MGWSLFPVAYLPGQSSFEVSMTSQQFDASLFELSNGTTFEADTISMPFTGNYDVVGKKVVLKTDTSIKDTVLVDGLEKADAAAAGKFAVEETAPENDGDQYVTTISIEDDASVLNVTYYETIEVTGGGIDNRTTAIGEMTMQWPKLIMGLLVVMLTANSLKRGNSQY